LKKTYFVFNETQYYREQLEFKHLKGQNTLVSLTIFFMMILTALYMFLSNYAAVPIIGFALGYLVILIFNFAALSYAREYSYFMKFNKYITSITLFTITVAMIIYFKSPSFIPLLFVVYAICSIYKDIKVLLVITVYFLFSILMLILNYQNIFAFQNNFVIKDLAIAFFVFLFLLILLSSSFIIVKEKTFFYNNISYAKEKEFRNLDLLMEFKMKGKTNISHNRDYYQDTEDLLEEFRKKIDIPDIFTEKIEILKKLEKGIEKSIILNEHHDFTKLDLERLENLLVNKNSKLRRLILKIKHSQLDKIKTREIFSATHFQSFNKQSDNLETKILCFVVYYATLKKGLPGMKSLSNKELYDTFINSDFYRFIDPKVIKVYQENADVFDQIVDEVMVEVKNND